MAKRVCVKFTPRKVAATGPTKDEIIAGLTDANDAFSQATDDYLDALANGTQAQIRAALLALIAIHRTLKQWEVVFMVYQLSTIPGSE